jgi:hypothetical protein
MEFLTVRFELIAIGERRRFLIGVMNLFIEKKWQPLVFTVSMFFEVSTSPGTAEYDFDIGQQDRKNKRGD